MLVKTLRLLAAGIITLSTIHSNAQYTNYVFPYQDTKGSSALNFNLGGTTFLGDLGGTKGRGEPFIKDFNGKTIRPLVGVYYSYFPYSWLSVKAGFNFTTVTGADSLITIKTGTAAGRWDRNLSFKSKITEFSADAEFYPIQTQLDFEEARLRPFVGVGIGMFHFDPQTKLNGQWVRLQPLHLEGQGFAEYPERQNYKLTQLYIPLTFGLKYRISSNYFISASAVFRKTFTDYIDDVSTTYIDPNLFDKYLSAPDAAVAKKLYYRGKASPSHPLDPTRGYASNDSYTSVFLTLTYFFNKREIFF